MERALILVQMFYEFGDPALVIELVRFVALFTLIFAVNSVGDGVRDVLDPRTRRQL